MNKRKIGYKFEHEANKYLKKYFDSVEWLSKKYHSSFDFKCKKGDIIYMGDAKVCNKNSNLQLRHSQKDADFIIAKIKGKIDLIFKKDFPKYKVYIHKEGFTSIKVSRDMVEFLNRLKFGRESYDTVIQRIINESNETKTKKVSTEQNTQAAS